MFGFEIGFLTGVLTIMAIAYLYWGNDKEVRPRPQTVVLRSNHEDELIKQLKKSTNTIQQELVPNGQYKPHIIRLITDNRKLISKIKNGKTRTV